MIAHAGKRGCDNSIVRVVAHADVAALARSCLARDAKQAAVPVIVEAVVAHTAQAHAHAAGSKQILLMAAIFRIDARGTVQEVVGLELLTRALRDGHCHGAVQARC